MSLVLLSGRVSADIVTLVLLSGRVFADLVSLVLLSGHIFADLVSLVLLSGRFSADLVSLMGSVSTNSVMSLLLSNLPISISIFPFFHCPQGSELSE